jgi:hypothetical protein
MRLTERQRPQRMTEVYPGLYAIGEIFLASEADTSPPHNGYWGADWHWFPPTAKPVDLLGIW